MIGSVKRYCNQQHNNTDTKNMEKQSTVLSIIYAILIMLGFIVLPRILLIILLIEGSVKGRWNVGKNTQNYSDNL